MVGILKKEFENYKNVYDFIKGSIEYTLNWKFPMDTTPIRNENKTSEVTLICKDRCFKLHITLGAIYSDTGFDYKTYQESKAEQWFGVFDDLFAEGMKSKDVVFSSSMMSELKNKIINLIRL